ncbi:MAG: uridine diphosphate-N-acetylglucosamine-binding protein YvcK [Syntrophales bacterium]|nr:uridine diphosphate-N-acetylglucosamine-binding protein YvcK [Syntrophales bacterium]MDY0044819.1 uridine diphosphate-N-acetylglucosamine-binding protein YvcK [Syntrophales bacterium]
MNKRMQKVVTIGGGSGQFALLAGLRDLEGIDITAIVSMADSGGSTGRLRDELGILPPGDVLKCVLALSPQRDIVRTILLKRLKGDNRLQGHNAGNMLLTMLAEYTGNFATGVNALSEILDARGTILPVTIDKTTLVAELTDGSRIYGQRAINVPRETQREKIKDIYLVPHHHDDVAPYPPVIEAIRRADHIIVGPGDLFTSIIPNLLVPGVKEAIMDTRANVFYIVNIMTKYGETNTFSCCDFVQSIEFFIGRPVDGVIYNTEKPDPGILKRYRKYEQSEFVEIDTENPFWKSRTLYCADLLSMTGGIARHDSRKLADILQDMISGTSKKTF